MNRIGAACGAAATSTPMAYVAFVVFGIITLLSLVCSELLIEARKAQGAVATWMQNDFSCSVYQIFRFYCR